MDMKTVDVKADSDLSDLKDRELRACKIHYTGYLPHADAVTAIEVINKHMVRRHPYGSLDLTEAEVADLPPEERAVAAEFRGKHEGKSSFEVFGELVEAGEIGEWY